ncbi:hypothetical protein BJ138DRAFT_368512 [Hygrophoropsis aurantiaca]|uniref:Uncharacterized protein n=1 Tax=Hygrophoropsis aurantiaca TaxID=72124 RepID=A0ACB8AM74_9AGAM|nr:hypothetical protein BJ138DRAFT_368512 [Hygrophoropsis aurantiaca]
MNRHLNSELSLRHLPDLSDDSLSFQIPAETSSTDFLLADNTAGFDFLRAAEDETSFATCAPTPKVDPLTLSHLTPRVDRSISSPPGSPSPGPSSHPIQHGKPLRLGNPNPSKGRKLLSPKAPRIKSGSDISSTSEERFQSLRAQVETLDGDCDSTAHVRSEPGQHGNTSSPKPLSQMISNPNVKPIVKRNPTVVSGAVTKPVVGRSKKPNFPNITQSIANDSIIPTSSRDFSVSHNVFKAAEEIAPSVNVVSETSFASDANQSTRLSTGGVAERLVSYSQKLISSIGLYRSRSENSLEEDPPADRTDAHARVEETQLSSPPASHSPPPVLTGNQDPFRLSEISPTKGQEESEDAPDGRVSIRGAPQMSPMRPSRKRCSADDDLHSKDHPQRKKGKTVLPGADLDRGSPELGSRASHVLQPSTHKNYDQVHDTASRKNAFPTSNIPAARTKYKPKPNTQRTGLLSQSNPHSSTLVRAHGTSRQGKGKIGEERTTFPTTRSVSSLSTFSGTSHHRPDALRKKNSAIVQVQQRSSQPQTGHIPMFEKPGVTLPTTNPTKPVAFTFRVDARMEARRAEVEERIVAIEKQRADRMIPQALPVPDFKALHLAHQATLASRKPVVVPIIPSAPFELSTEQRAREREKFDDMVRRKEEEIERIKAERRRQQEEEEEREIKELRRKAIPKAHEVPEWYADMPKRKGIM